MKLNIISILHLLTICASSLLLSSVSQAKEDIIFAVDFSSDHKLFNIGEQVLEEVSKRIGEPIKLISVPSKRSSSLLKKKEIHAELARIGEYEKRVPFAIKVEEPIIEVSQHAYSYNLDIPINSWESLRPYRIVALRGSWIVETYMPDYEVVWVGSMDAAFKFLMRGRADLFIAPSARTDMFLTSTKAHAKGIRRLEPAVHMTQDFTFFNPEYPKLAVRYEEALKAMKADGSYKSILSQVGM
jgi:ABC-type amino acid transport substrate-binding protein